MSTIINLTNREIDGIFHEVRKDGYYTCRMSIISDDKKDVFEDLLSIKGVMYRRTIKKTFVQWRYCHHSLIAEILIDTFTPLYNRDYEMSKTSVQDG